MQQTDLSLHNQETATVATVQVVSEYTVSSIARAIKGTIEQSFSNIRVKGEVSGIKYADSGHVYFSLKDEGAVLHAICWKGVAARLPFKLEDGLEIICTGSISTYPGRSIYQITASNIEVSGVGALLKMLEQRKKTLAAEGLFDPARKKQLPYMPQVIGVITSPSGAVIRDILHRVRERFPVHVLVWGVLVQGPEAAEQIARAIDGFHSLPSSIPTPDVLIVARGGGSVEDLWPFNEEVVVRAVVRANIPIISAVGHETDTTLIDYASDKRAPTPTAAAEIAVPVKQDLEQKIAALNERLSTGLPNLVASREAALKTLTQGFYRAVQLLTKLQNHVDQLSLRLLHALHTLYKVRLQHFIGTVARLQWQHLATFINIKQLALDRLQQAFNSAVQKIMVKCETSLILSSKLLDSYSYHKVLSRGFAIVRGNDGQILRSVTDAVAVKTINIEFNDGACDAVVQMGDSASVDAVLPIAPKIKSAVKNNNRRLPEQHKQQMKLL